MLHDLEFWASVYQPVLGGPLTVASFAPSSEYTENRLGGLLSGTRVLLHLSFASWAKQARTWLPLSHEGVSFLPLE